MAIGWATEQALRPREGDNSKHVDYIIQQMPDIGGHGLSLESKGRCRAFAEAYMVTSGSQPLNPEALLLAWEGYQDLLGREAVDIDWLPDDQCSEFRSLIRAAIRDSAGIIGCSEVDAADSMLAWFRGVLNQITRW